MQNKPRFYLPELDGLRFIAFLLVFIHNAPYDTSNLIWKAIRDHTWVGLDLFFCLSGCLITKLLVLEQTETGKIHFRSFYIRRVLRILPLYFFLTTFSIIYTVSNRGWNSEIFQRAAGLLTFTDNFLTAILNFTILSFSFHLWTISYEIQFYLIAPLLVSKLQETSQKTKLVFLVSAFLIGSLIRVALIYLDVQALAIYVLPFTHFDSILGGIIIGLGLLDAPGKLKNRNLLPFSILCLTLAFLLPDKDITGLHLIILYTLIGIGFTFITQATLHSNNLISRVVLQNSYTVYLGKISYGLYIYHIPSIYLATFALLWAASQSGDEIQSQSVFILGFILTILISALSYQFIEAPILKLKTRFSYVSSKPV